MLVTGLQRFVGLGKKSTRRVVGLGVNPSRGATPAGSLDSVCWTPCLPSFARTRGFQPQTFATAYPPGYHLSNMAGEDDLVTVPKSLFDSLRQHCENCPYLGEQLQSLSNKHTVIIPSRRSSSVPTKKQKTLHRSGLQEVLQPSHSSQQPEPQLSSQPSQQFPSQSSHSSQGENPKRVRAKRPRKNAAADWFLKNTPKASRGGLR